MFLLTLVAVSSLSQGGIGIVHYNCPIEEQAMMVRSVILRPSLSFPSLSFPFPPFLSCSLALTCSAGCDVAFLL